MGKQFYQQTFWGQENSEWSFRFNRVYKSRPENKLIIRVIQCVAGVGATSKPDLPYLIFLNNAADITGKCNLFVNDNGTLSQNGNPFVLGISGSSAHPITSSGNPQITVSELPLNEMTISVQHYDGSAVGTLFCVVVFEIEEVEV